jgi:hypothetical protein
MESVRQEQSDGCRGPKTGEYAYQGPHENAQETEEKIHRLEDDLGAEQNVAKYIHLKPEETFRELSFQEIDE